MRAERESWEKKQQEVGQLASELRNVRVTTLFHTYIRGLLYFPLKIAKCSSQFFVSDLQACFFKKGLR